MIFIVRHSFLYFKFMREKRKILNESKAYSGKDNISDYSWLLVISVFQDNGPRVVCMCDSYTAKCVKCGYPR